jgi:glutamyl/glutaminyl-tRNA synthetase
VRKQVAAELLVKICAVERERLVTMVDIVDKVEPYLKIGEFPVSLLVWKKSSTEDAGKQLRAVRAFLSRLDLTIFASVGLLETAMRDYIKQEGLENGSVLWPLRAALSGRSASPSPFELIYVLGKDESIARVTRAVELFDA